MPDVVSTAKSIIVLLNNINDLITISNKRREAKDVMRAMVVYADSNAFPIPQEKVNVFYSKLIDSRPNALSELVRSIATDVIQISMKSRSKKPNSTV